MHGLMSRFVVATLTFQISHPQNRFHERHIRPSCSSIYNIELKEKAM